MYKLVPVEMTDKMLSALDFYVAAGEENCTDGHRAMFDAAPNPWRPIAEAPKDGTYFLVRQSDGPPFVANQPGNCGLGVWVKMDGRWAGSARYYGKGTDFIPLEWLGSPEGK